MNRLDAIFKPESIAIYGCSNNPTKVGGRPLRYLLEQGYQGKIYPINPNYDTVQGIPCYHSTEDIPYGVDLVIIVINASATLNALQQCIDRGIKSAVVLTAGFAEVGEEGKQMQKKMVEMANAAGMAILGPNCLGMINVKDKIPATFASVLEQKDILSGSVAMLSQSGAFGNHILGMAQQMKVGFNYWITTGNEAGIQLNDCIEYAAEDPETTAIAAYAEDVRDGAKFIHALDTCIAHEKPVVMLKVGQTQSGSKAAASHTGALAGNFKVYEAVFKQKGVILAGGLYELLDTAFALGLKKKVKGNRLSVITISGGAGAMLADNCESNGLELAALSDQTKAEMKAILPVFASVNNPVDITAQAVADPSLFGNTLEKCLQDDATDAVIIYLGLLKNTAVTIANKIAEIAETTEKPIAVTWVAGPQEVFDILRSHSVMAFDEPIRTMKALGNFVKYHLFLENKKKEEKEALTDTKDHSEIKKWLSEIAKERKALTEHESRKVLQDFGVPVVEGDMAVSSEEAVALAEKLGYPVVMKVNSPEVLHKSDAGGVILNVKNADEVRAAYQKILDNVHAKCGESVVIDGMLVQKMQKFEAETMIGMNQDPMFGPAVVFGLGGIFVEVFKDVSLRVAPLCRAEAEDMVKSIRSYPILNGARGRKICDQEAIIETILKVASMSLELKDLVKELDINPLFVSEKGEGARAGDALIVLK